MLPLGGLTLVCGAVCAQETQRPNIVWFLTEDLSPHYMAIYNDGEGAATPNVERLAAHGVRYTNAYSNAPVSSAARTTLITGCYAPRLAGSLHRRLQPMVMPEGLRMFPTYFRRAGYYTCNAQKTDYNVVLDKEAWCEIKGELDSWRFRPDKSRPFFFQRSNMLTHESKLQFDSVTWQTVVPRHDMNRVRIHATLPTTALERYTYATFYDRIADSDAELGRLIDMLEQEGELDNTFIFYFGDNGGSLPGTKGYTNDIGIHVPLVVYIPDRWKDKLGIPLGSVDERIVSFVDFAPTILRLAGLDIPDEMDGRPFLGESDSPQERFAVGYGDRFDELYAFNRTLRQGKYRYARNYIPYHTRSLFAFYRYKQLAFREYKDLYAAGALNDEQSAFFEKMGPEELYDLERDPDETTNLVDDPALRPVVDSMRQALNRYMIDKCDLGFFPECVILEEAMASPSRFGEAHRQQIASYVAVADLQLDDYTPATQRQLRQAIASDDAVLRWWGLTSAAWFTSAGRSPQIDARALLSDERSFVRSRAAILCAMQGERLGKEQWLSILNHARNGAEVLLVLNDLTYAVEQGLVEPFALEMSELRFTCTGVDWRLQYLNAWAANPQHATTSWSRIY